MPHLILEHTDATQGDMPALCQAVFDAACGCSTFPNPSDVKVRTRLCANHTGGTGDHFVHATVRMLEGRTNEAKREVSEAVFGAMLAQLPNCPSLTVEIVDMHGPSYVKRYL